MIREKQFRLILREPGRKEEVLAIGSEEFIAKERTKESLSHNAAFLVIEEVKEGEDVEEITSNIKGVVISLVVSLVILLVYGKKREK